MKYILPFLIILFIFSSCIPLRIAPNIKENKVVKGKRFKKDLPNQNAFIFNDPKDANEFYNYINTKFQLNDVDVEFNVPFTIEDSTLYLSFYEVEKTTKTLNIVPVAIDASINKNGDPMLEDAYISRSGSWYIAITVNDNDLNDVLHEKHGLKPQTIEYLENLRKEYVNTQNYLEVVFKK